MEQQNNNTAVAEIHDNTDFMLGLNELKEALVWYDKAAAKADNMFAAHDESVIDVHIEGRETHIDEVKLDRSLADLAISVPHESGVTLLTKVRT